MAHTVELSPLADRQLAKLPRQDQARIVAELETLAENPRPAGAKKLKGQDRTYRLRVGSYRIVYDVYDRLLWVLVLRVGHRKDVYSGELRGKALRELIARRLLEKGDRGDKGPA
jgi:mRNA interferase RelE/StbE